MLGQTAELLACLQIPEPDKTVGAAGDRAAAVGARGNRPQHGRMPEPAQLAARRHVPEPDRLVMARCQEALPVRQDADPLDPRMLMPHESCGLHVGCIVRFSLPRRRRRWRASSASRQR